MLNRVLRPVAPATFLGLQEGYVGDLPVALFKLEAAVGDHPVGSTVTHSTLERHGFEVPAWVLQARAAAPRRRIA
jgi:hypothetical protein